MIETWVNIIETLICIHIIQKIKEIIPEKENKEEEQNENEGIEEGKTESLLGKIKNYDYKGLLGSNEEKESMFESYEILEHKYYEKMQQLVVKLKEEQSQLKYQLGSTQDAYEFELDINLEATQSKIPITRESLLSLNDIFTKTKRFMKGDKKTWKENVTEFINKHFMNDLVDDIVTKSHYNSSNVMSIIQDQIPQLRFLNNTNMKENFFSTIVEQEGKQYDDETKTKFTKYYHHFFLENLNGKINNKPVNTPEGLKELQNLLKEFQKLRDPEFYVEEKEEEYKEKEKKGEKEILEKIDMTYESNLNLMRDFVKGNMKTKFEAYVESRVEVVDSSVELKTERVIELIKEVSDKLEEQKDNIIEDTEKINEQLVEIKKLQEIIENQKEIIENQKEDYSIQKEEDKDKYSKLKDAHKKEMDDELKKGSEEFQKKIEIIQNLEGDKYEINSKLNEYLNELDTTKKELREKNNNNNILLENNEKQQKEINNLKINIEETNTKHEETIKKINEDKTADKEKAIKELKDEHEKKLDIIETELKEKIITNQSLYKTIESRDTQINELSKTIVNLQGLTKEQREKLEAMEKEHQEEVNKLKEKYKTDLQKEKKINDDTRDKAADEIREDYKKELNDLQDNHLSELDLLKKQIENLNIYNKELSDIIEQKNQEIGSLNEIKQSLEELNNGNEEKINELTSKITELKHINKQEKEQIINAIKQYASQLSQFKPNEENELDEINNSALERINNSLATHINRLTDENNELKEKLMLKNEEENKTQTTNKELQEKINSLEQQKNDLKSQLTLTQNKLNEKQDELKTSESKLKVIQDKNTELQKEKAELETDLKELEDTNNKLTEVIKQKEEQIITKQQEIDKQQEIIRELRKQLEDNKNQIAEDLILIRKQQQKIEELNDSLAKLTSEKKEKEAELNARKEKEEDEERKRLAEEERKRQEEEAQRQKEEAERIRQEEEEKERPKKEAIENLTIFLDKTTELITYINSITLTTWNTKKTKTNDPLYVINFPKMNTISTSDIIRQKVEELQKEYGIINKLTTLYRYVKALTFIKTSIEDNSIIDLEEYSQFVEDKDQDQYFQIMKDGSTTTFPHLRPKFIKNLISTLNNICANKNYIKKVSEHVSEKCNIFRNEFYESSNRIDENEQYIKLFETTMNSVRVYFKQIHRIERKIPKTKTSAKQTEPHTRAKKNSEETVEIISENIYEAVDEVIKKLNHFISKFKNENKEGLLFYKTKDKNNKDTMRLNENIQNSYKVIQNFGNFCEGNFVLKPDKYNGLYSKIDKETATKFNIELKYEKVINEKDNNKPNTRVANRKIPCIPEFDKHIYKILNIFNDAFVKQDNQILQTPPPNSKTNNSDATTENLKFDTPSSLKGENTENNNDVKGYPSNRSATPVNLEFGSPLPRNGGKKKTRRKGRTKKKTKTRKK